MRLIDLTGARFGKLTVVARGENTATGHPRWICNCECGGATLSGGQSLRSGLAQSCGCERVANASKASSVCNRTHGQSGSAIYAIWRGMVARCTVPTNKDFARYGGRGITVCDRWMKFEDFFADFGFSRPSERHSIDRRDNGKGYELGNVRWALPVEQQNNRRDTVLLTLDGETLSMAQWSRKAGAVSPTTLARRLKHGWPLQHAIHQPPTPRQLRRAGAAF